MAKKKTYRFFLYLICRLAAFVIFLLPRKMALRIAKAGSGIVYPFLIRQRKKTLHHLRRAYGNQKSEQEIQRIAKKVFENLALTAVEVVQFPKLNSQKIDSLVDIGNAFEVYNSLLSEGRGFISVTAHLGNWELLAGVCILKGYKGTVLARRLYYEPYNRWILNLRSSVGVPTIYRDQFSKEILKILARNEIIGILPDQDISSLKGVFVDFFGKPAYTPVTPARLSISSGAPILPNFLIRQKDFRYRLIVGEAIRPPVGLSRDEAALRMTENWMRQFEKVIRDYPEQWAWMHNRWQTQPKKKEKEYDESVLFFERPEGVEKKNGLFSTSGSTGSPSRAKSRDSNNNVCIGRLKAR